MLAAIPVKGLFVFFFFFLMKCQNNNDLLVEETARSTDTLGATLLLRLGEEVSELLVRRHAELGLGPQVRGQVAVGVTNGSKGSLDKVTQGAGGTEGLGVAVSDTGKLEKLLGNGSSDNTGTTRSRDQTSDG